MRQTSLLERKQNAEKNCMDCLIYKYQDDFHRIVTQRQRYCDEVLTICCRTCNQHSNFYDSKIYGDKVNDVFVKKLEIKLKQILGLTEYNKEKERIREELTWMKKI